MIRTIIIIAVILIAMPFIDHGVDYLKEKSKALGTSAKKIIHYKD